MHDPYFIQQYSCHFSDWLNSAPVTAIPICLESGSIQLSYMHYS